MRSLMKSIGSMILLFAMLLRVSPAMADEGMWLLMFLNKNYEEMNKLGLKLSPEDIYSVNESSLKDAVVSLQFCTAEIVSNEGLMFTNHHCAYDAIRSHSSTQNNYLDNGFWAKSKNDELPVEGMTASILIRMDDVTDRINASLEEDMNEAARGMAIQAEIAKIVAEATEGTFYNAEVKSMLEGNQYILFVHETFRDVRLVGAPPSSIGKYGGDQDNWEWPRHTGDFAMLRIYTSPDGEPAGYSEENIPYKPRHHFPVSLKGYDLGDYSMVMGYPGRTQRYLTSYGIEMAQNVSNPVRIKLREQVLASMKEDMARDESIRIKYAAKYAQISNYYKYFIGQNEGLQNLGTIDIKKEQEEAFRKWVNADTDRKAEYGNVLDDLKRSYEDMARYELYFQYLVEGAFNIELLGYALNYRGLEALLEAEEAEQETIDAMTADLRSAAEEHFKNYNQPTDKRIFAAMLKMYYDDMPADQRPPVLNDLHKKYKGNWEKMADRIYKKSFLANYEDNVKFLENPSAKKLKKDPGFSLANEILMHYLDYAQKPLRQYRGEQSVSMRKYLKGLMEMYPDRFFYPDANSSLRLTYGTIGGYTPRDAVRYTYYTTLDGLIAKGDPSDPEFQVPEKLKQLHRSANYGRYAAEDGQLRVNFISNNDITGGNSGSPVLNGSGELIGIAFDGNWEAMTGDLDFEDDIQRTISVDIRYALFIIDKFANASHLIQEMTIIE